MKYIDAEKLKAEIERRIESWTIRGKHSPAGQGRDTCESRVTELSDLLSFITSLQQEQQDNEEKFINFFDALGDCGFSQHDIFLLKNIWKEAGCPPSKSQVADASKMEQPEVDLEKEIKRFLSNATKMNKGEWRGKYPISDIGFRAVARHFYELGLNARKEE